MPRELAQPALELVPAHGGETELRYDESHPHLSERRVQSPDVKKARPDSRTRAQQALDVR
jgi:hypothetical protein